MPVLIILILLGAGALWALSVYGFKPLGKLVHRIGGDIKGAMSEEEFDEDNDEENKED